MNKTPQILKGRLSTMYKPLEGVLSLSAKFYLLSFGLETLPENHLKSGWSTVYRTEPIQTIILTGVERILGTVYKRRLQFFLGF